jgi:DNA polymerase III subunit beta
MSFVSLNKTSLQTAIALANQVSPKKSDIEVFSYTRCEFQKNTLIISALQSYAFFQASIKLDNNDSDKDLVFLIKTDLLANTVATITDDVISLDIDLAKHTLVVQGAKSKHTLRIDTDRISDFVQPEEKPDELVVKIKVNAQELTNADKIAFTTVGLPKNVFQPEFLNICYTIVPEDKKIKVVSCDKFRISKTILAAELEHTSPEFVEVSRDFLVQPKGVQLLHACLNNEQEISLNFEKSKLWVHMDNSVLVLRYGEGVYPNYENIIPKSYTCNFVVNTNDLRQALKQVYLTARANAVNKSLSMKIEPTNKKMTFSSQSDDGFASEALVDIITYEGVQDDWLQSFNADYLLDFVSNVTTENVVFDANPGKPMVLSPEGLKETQICMVQGLR